MNADDWLTQSAGRGKSTVGPDKHTTRSFLRLPIWRQPCIRELPDSFFNESIPILLEFQLYSVPPAISNDNTTLHYNLLLWPSFLIHLCVVINQYIEAGTKGRHFADDIFKCIFVNENPWISNKISLKFFPNVPINNIQGVAQIMAWRRSGAKPLSEPIMASLLSHICVTRPQRVNGFHQFMQYLTTFITWFLGVVT